ncbi:MAG: TlpA disulfide reductase family protein [Armatimonas sp.]
MKLVHRLSQIVAVVVCALLPLAASALGDSELTFGSPAPEFKATMLRGGQVASLARGQIYVIEFGGTRCVPCIKFIPKMNALQKRYPGVTFISVFCESPDAVKPFLKGPGKAMEVRIALDTASGHMQKNWMNASGLLSIPQAFIVDKSGNLAWFGSPDQESFAETLGKVVNGTYDNQLDQMRMELQRKLGEENQKSFEWIEKVNEVVRRAYACKTPEESIALLDSSLPNFVGAPEHIVLSTLKLDFFKKLPQSRERAYQQALSLAVEAVNQRNPNYYVDATEAMLSHFESALPENKDRRLVDLALAVLLNESAPTNHIKLDADAEASYQVNRLAAIASAYHMRGEGPAAVSILERAIAKLQAQESSGKPQWWIDAKKDKLARLKSKLVAWSGQSNQ